MANRSGTSNRGVVGTTLVVSALVGIALGLVALFQPGGTLVTIATLFGVALIVAGVFRLLWAVLDGTLSGPARVALGLLGVVVLVAGVLALFRPVATLAFVGLVIGISWILGGVRDLVFGLRGVRGFVRGLAIVSGAVSILGGIVILVLPLFALQTFIQIGGILLVVVSVASLLTLPARRSQA